MSSISYGGKPQISKYWTLLFSFFMCYVTLQGDWIKPGAVVIDCGINVIPGKIFSVSIIHWSTYGQ